MNDFQLTVHLSFVALETMPKYASLTTQQPDLFPRQESVQNQWIDPCMLLSPFLFPRGIARSRAEGANSSTISYHFLDVRSIQNSPNGWTDSGSVRARKREGVELIYLLLAITFYPHQVGLSHLARLNPEWGPHLKQSKKTESQLDRQQSKTKLRE